MSRNGRFVGGYDNRIIPLHKELDHVCEARNMGMRAATGEYIIWIDSDDYVELNAIERMLSVIEENKADVVISNVYAHWPDGRINKDKEFVFKKIKGEDALKKLYTTNEGGYALWNKLIRKKVIDETNASFKRVSGQYSEDALFLTQIYSNCASVVAMNECFYHYIISNNSTSRGGVLTEEKLKAWIDSIDIFMDTFQKLKISMNTRNVLCSREMDYLHLLHYISLINGMNNSKNRISSMISLYNKQGFIASKKCNSVISILINIVNNKYIIKPIHKCFDILGVV